MLDDKGPPTGSTRDDPLTIGAKIAALEPVRPRRRDGAVHEARGLGRLEFVRMPKGRPSFWHGRLSEAGRELKLVCEVEDDERPGADYAASVVAVRRRMAKDIAASLPLVQARLQRMKRPHDIAADDLVLSGIHLAPRPLVAARQVLEYRLRSAPELLFMVVFVHGRPSAAHVDSEI